MWFWTDCRKLCRRFISSHSVASHSSTSPKPMTLIQSFHTEMKGTVRHDGASSEAFGIHSGMKQGCVLAHTLFGSFFAVMLWHCFGSATDGIYLLTRSDGKLFSLSQLKAKPKCARLLSETCFLLLLQHWHPIQETIAKPPRLLLLGLWDFSLTISLKKTNMMGQEVKQPPVITVDNYELEVMHQFMYLGSTITDNLFVSAEINRWISWASTTHFRLIKESVGEQQTHCPHQNSSIHCLHPHHAPMLLRLLVMPPRTLKLHCVLPMSVQAY